MHCVKLIEISLDSTPATGLMIDCNVIDDPAGRLVANPVPVSQSVPIN